MEVCIALFLHDRFIRPYVGDFLAVIFLYTFFRSFFNLNVLTTSLIVLLISYFIEFLQYLNFIELIGWQHSKPARIVLGYSFEWVDMLAYTLGIVLVVVIERLRMNK
jgi:hypothetical protein